MAEKACKATVWGERGHSHQCNNKAGYGPGKAYCKIHAREKGEKFGEIVTLYRVMAKDWKRPTRIAEVEVEATEKTYRLSGNDSDFDFARKFDKDQCPRLGIFTTKRQALDYFLKRAGERMEATSVAAAQAENDFKLAELFVREQEED